MINHDKSFPIDPHNHWGSSLFFVNNGDTNGFGMESPKKIVTITGHDGRLLSGVVSITSTM